ncbi:MULTISPECIES: hypothetical protein [Pseudomonas syringae group]|uniref:Uncharacterized protein n=2 Tax=Pseudomonas syringae group TaxID=136849 RepID=A0A0P9MZS0_PSESX|nr:Uncharacterized protein ALO79_04524 [Pseudomonas syringae pv. castaneae]RMS89144.1 hypothetical protein ALP58_102139 [Pseudomonas savastanoi]
MSKALTERTARAWVVDIGGEPLDRRRHQGQVLELSGNIFGFIVQKKLVF